MDVLFVTAASRKRVYQELASELAALEVPVWSGLLANYARKNGFKAGILDAEALGLDSRETAMEICKRAPLLVVFVVYGQQPSASTQCMPAAREACLALKKIAPHISTLVLGTHVSALPEKTLQEEPFEFVCEGEGPYTISSLLKSLKNKNENLTEVPGLWFMQQEKIIKGPKSQNIENLDRDLPGIAWDLLDMNLYRAHNWHCFDGLENRQPYASLPTSLGCPYHCNFCCINAPFGKSGIRYWSADFIGKQIDILVKEYGIRNIKIPDEMFVLNEKHMFGICDHIIEHKYDLNIWAYARVDTIKEKYLPKLKAAGFRWLALGIESSSKFVRDGMEKGRFQNEQIIEVVKMVQAHGISVCGNYIFGLPDDTQQSMEGTLNLAKSINTEWANFYCAMAYPGSQLYRKAIEQGIALPEDWGGYSQHSYECLPLPTDTLSSAQVLKFRDHAFLNYYLDPEYLTYLENRFGSKSVQHVKQMCSKSIKRKLLELPNGT